MQPTDPAILADQVAYYRKRAGEYDEWWFRTGRYDHGPELNAAWNADVAAVEKTLCDYLDARRPSRALELACGTGLFTRWVAPRVGHLLALDASPEVQDINRHRVQADNVEYALADLFAWQPQARYDFVFMSFWLSHVPDDRFDAFWAKVRSALIRRRQRLRDRFGLGYDLDRDQSRTAGPRRRQSRSASSTTAASTASSRSFTSPTRSRAGSPCWDSRQRSCIRRATSSTAR